jgi:small-conductance mechanosensitive channel
MSQLGPLESALDRFVESVVGALPNVFSGLVFLLVAAIGIKLLTWLLRQALDRVLAAEDVVYRQFIVTVVAALLWFGLIAASFGTASGFVALGVAYALSGMIEDAVAGVYLLRDPDFNAGDTVTAADITGEVSAIELRKTRFRVDGATVVKGNGAIEKSWTKHEE